MRAADRPLALLVLGLALAACDRAPSDASTNNAAVMEIEALPPDESVATPTNELVNGADEPSNTDAAQY